MQILLLTAIFPAMLGANELLSRWATIEVAYNDIKQAYPAVLWIMALLLVLLVVCFTMFLLERQKRRRDRANELTSLTDRQCANVREYIEKRMAKENQAKADVLKRQTAELTGRDSALKQAAARLHCREQQVIAKWAELEKEHIAVADKADTLTYWLSQVDCAIKVMVEEHDAVGKISAYLAQWVDLAATDPQRFTTEVSTAGKFDQKRFDRSKRQLSSIYDRYAEIQRELVNTAQILKEGGYNELDKK